MEQASEDQTDAELLGRYFEGDPGAFDVLNKRWRGRLSRYFQTFDLNHDTIEDLIQETFIRLYLLRDDADFDRQRPLDRYVQRMARNLALNARRNRRETPTADDELLLLLERPDDTWDDGELMEAIRQCLEGLPPDARSVILKCGKHGLGEASHEAIAAASQKWPSQVSQRCHRARVLLRGCLARKGYR